LRSREIIGGAIAIISVGALGVIGVAQTFLHLPFSEPSALAAVAGASVAVYLSNAGNTSTAETMSNGFLGAVAQSAATQAATRAEAPVPTFPHHD
jgi:hypothetical protein